METLSEILEKGVQANSDQELKPLTAAIARNKATDRLRRQLTEKRGGNKLQSLEELVEANAGELPDVPHAEFVDQLAIQELKDLLTELSAEVKREYRVVLRDHFLDELSYNEIAAKRRISVGSVGVYVQRGLASLRNVIARKPKLQTEFLAMLSDARVVKVLLPLVSALELGGWFIEHRLFPFCVPIDESKLSDEERLRIACEDLLKAQPVSEQQRTSFAEKLRLKYPAQFQLWQQKQEEHRRRQEPAPDASGALIRALEFNLRYRRSIVRDRIIAVLILLALLCGLVCFILWLL